MYCKLPRQGYSINKEIENITKYQRSYNWTKNTPEELTSKVDEIKAQISEVEHKTMENTQRAMKWKRELT